MDADGDGSVYSVCLCLVIIQTRVFHIQIAVDAHGKHFNKERVSMLCLCACMGCGRGGGGARKSAQTPSDGNVSLLIDFMQTISFNSIAFMERRIFFQFVRIGFGMRLSVLVARLSSCAEINNTSFDKRFKRIVCPRRSAAIATLGRGAATIHRTIGTQCIFNKCIRCQNDGILYVFSLSPFRCVRLCTLLLCDIAASQISFSKCTANEELNVRQQSENIGNCDVKHEVYVCVCVLFVCRKKKEIEWEKQTE